MVNLKPSFLINEDERPNLLNLLNPNNLYFLYKELKVNNVDCSIYICHLMDAFMGGCLKFEKV